MMPLTSGPQEESDPEVDHEVDGGAVAHSGISNYSSDQSQGQYSERPDGGVQILEKSQASQVFENMLMTCYMPMEVWYARSVIDKVLFA